MLKSFFNYCAEKPSQQYTLGGDRLSIKFNRAGRFIERLTTVPTAAVGAFFVLGGLLTAVAAPPAGISMIATGMLVAGFGKAAGVVKGGLFHLAAAGLSGIANRMSENRQQAQVQAPAAPKV
ncbi:MAG: hypothetical protein ACAH80_11465 [Alphaproteobacteria bacterium]